MRDHTAPLIRREDYVAPAFWIKTVDLAFDLDATRTLVTSRMLMERNPALPSQALRLNGDDLVVLRVLGLQQQLVAQVGAHLGAEHVHLVSARDEVPREPDQPALRASARREAAVHEGDPHGRSFADGSHQPRDHFRSVCTPPSAATHAPGAPSRKPPRSR